LPGRGRRDIHEPGDDLITILVFVGNPNRFEVRVTPCLPEQTYDAVAEDWFDSMEAAQAAFQSEDSAAAGLRTGFSWDASQLRSTPTTASP
jgi:hypothetical protein